MTSSSSILRMPPSAGETRRRGVAWRNPRAMSHAGRYVTARGARGFIFKNGAIGGVAFFSCGSLLLNVREHRDIIINK